MNKSFVFVLLFICVSHKGFTQNFCEFADTCKMGTLLSINFSKNQYLLTIQSKLKLKNFAETIRQGKVCKIKIINYLYNDKCKQQLGWLRANAIYKYMIEQEGISPNRFIFSLATQSINANAVFLDGADENETSSVMPAQPYPTQTKFTANACKERQLKN